MPGKKSAKDMSSTRSGQSVGVMLCLHRKKACVTHCAHATILNLAGQLARLNFSAPSVRVPDRFSGGSVAGSGLITLTGVIHVDHDAPNARSGRAFRPPDPLL